MFSARGSGERQRLRDGVLRGGFCPGQGQPPRKSPQGLAQSKLQAKVQRGRIRVRDGEGERPRQQSYEVLPEVLWEDPEEWLQQALHEDERGDEGWGAGQRPLWTEMPPRMQACGPILGLGRTWPSMRCPHGSAGVRHSLKGRDLRAGHT